MPPPPTTTPAPAPGARHHQSQSSRRQRERLLTTVLVALTRVLERVDESLLPAVYYGVSCSLKISPSALGGISFVRLVVQALASPLGGALGLRFHRARVCGASCIAWAACCAAFAAVRSPSAAAAVWAINGVGLAILVPNAQGLIADLYPPKRRGRAFGMLLGVGHAGAMLATLFAASIGNRRFFVSSSSSSFLAGWRLAFMVVGAFSAAVGVATMALAHDPRDEGWGEPRDEEDGEEEDDGEEEEEDERAGLVVVGGGSSQSPAPAAATPAKPPLATTTRTRRRQGGPSSSSRRGPPPPQQRHHQHPDLSSLLSDARRVCAIPSFLVVVAQGALGSTPWSALAFMTLYLQLRGWPDAVAAAVLASFSAASALGSVLGGFVGDAAARPFPDHGRIAVCQLSVLSGVPLAAALFRVVPRAYSPAAVGATVAVLICKGVLTQWAATACNNPVFAEVVPPRLRTAVYALDRAFEGVLSALGAPLVGKAAEGLFGFGGGGGAEGGQAGSASAAGGCEDGRAPGGATRHAPDARRADALGSAMLLFTTVPWLLCALVYSFLHATYPRDRESAREAAEAEAAEVEAEAERGEAAEERRADRLVEEVEMGRLLPAPMPLSWSGAGR